MNTGYQHASLAEAENTLQYILEVIREGVWDWDARDGRVRRSPGWYRMLGHDPHSLKPDVFTWEDVIHPDDYQRVMAHFEAYINRQSAQYAIEYRCRQADGNYLWIEDRGLIVEQDDQGKVLRMVGAHLDIHTAITAQQALQRQNELLQSDNITLERLVSERTEALKELNLQLSIRLQQIEEIAARDKLTGVYNRHMFEEVLGKEFSRARRYSRPLALIMVDVDFFKQINDQHGHQAGDAVLRELALLLTHALRDADIVARWGGEEFVIILPDTPGANAAGLAEGLRRRIEQETFAGGIRLTCSFGVTDCRPDDSLDSVFARIDCALYRAKTSARNNVQIE